MLSSRCGQQGATTYDTVKSSHSFGKCFKSVQENSEIGRIQGETLTLVGKTPEAIASLDAIPEERLQDGARCPIKFHLWHHPKTSRSRVFAVFPQPDLFISKWLPMSCDVAHSRPFSGLATLRSSIGESPAAAHPHPALARILPVPANEAR